MAKTGRGDRGPLASAGPPPNVRPRRRRDKSATKGTDVDLETQERAPASSHGELEQTKSDAWGREGAAIAASSGGSGPEAREGRAAATFFVNAQMKQSTSCWRSALFASTQAWKASVGSWLGWYIWQSQLGVLAIFRFAWMIALQSPKHLVWQLCLDPPRSSRTLSTSADGSAWTPLSSTRGRVSGSLDGRA